MGCGYAEADLDGGCHSLWKPCMASFSYVYSCIKSYNACLLKYFLPPNRRVRSSVGVEVYYETCSVRSRDDILVKCV